MLKTALVGLCALLTLTPAMAVYDMPSTPLLQFGLLRNGHFVVTREVPNRPGVEYGWRARIGGQGMHHWKEVFSLPTAPKTWGTGHLSSDRRTSVTEGDAPVENGYLEVIQWDVAAGDPNGTYDMTIYIDGHRIGSLSFNVQPPL